MEIYKLYMCGYSMKSIKESVLNLIEINNLSLSPPNKLNYSIESIYIWEQINFQIRMKIKKKSTLFIINNKYLHINAYLYYSLFYYYI